ncbi:nadh dehydrogenase [ubiquinone] 1 beta subcomplex subunit 3-b, partial [Nicotiana attenuata]
MGKQLGTTGEFIRKRDEWRKHPMLTNQFRHAFPSLGIAVVAFSIYCVDEFAYNKMSSPSRSTSSVTASHSN